MSFINNNANNTKSATQISISHKAFASDHYYSRVCSGAATGKYVYHNLTASTTITIGGQEFDLVYQNGLDVEGGDLTCPTNDFDLSPDGGCDQVLIMIDEFLTDGKSEEESVDEIRELCPELDTAAKIIEARQYLLGIKPDFNRFLSEDVSDDPDDWELDERGEWSMVDREAA